MSITGLVGLAILRQTQAIEAPIARHLDCGPDGEPLRELLAKLRGQLAKGS
ncbi:MAG: hypothetical protein ACREPJ_16175 [Rhodanobacteraceae bacterium]